MILGEQKSLQLPFLQIFKQLLEQVFVLGIIKW